jgi:hypothetical protein
MLAKLVLREACPRAGGERASIVDSRFRGNDNQKPVATVSVFPDLPAAGRPWAFSRDKPTVNFQSELTVATHPHGPEQHRGADRPALSLLAAIQISIGIVAETSSWP